MNSKDTMKLARENGGFNYSRSANAVLLRMLSGTHRGKTPVPDISVLKMRTRITTVMKWATVTSVRQADRIIAELSASGVLRITLRAKGELHYTLDPYALLGLQPSGKFLKATIADRNKGRAVKARAQRAALKKKRTERKAFSIIGRCFGFVLNGAPCAEATRRKHRYPFVATA
jgi:hypothetical protein